MLLVVGLAPEWIGQDREGAVVLGAADLIDAGQVRFGVQAPGQDPVGSPDHLKIGLTVDLEQFVEVGLGHLVAPSPWCSCAPAWAGSWSTSRCGALQAVGRSTGALSLLWAAMLDAANGSDKADRRNMVRSRTAPPTFSAADVIRTCANCGSSMEERK